MGTFLAAYQSITLSLLRIISGFLFLQHGSQKVLGFPAPQRGPFEALSMIGVAGILELVGGALIILGLFTRPTAFILSGLMAFAYFIAHGPRDFWPLNNGGELAALYCFVFLYFFVAGAGKFSLDTLLRSKQNKFINSENSIRDISKT